MGKIIKTQSPWDQEEQVNLDAPVRFLAPAQAQYWHFGFRIFHHLRRAVPSSREALFEMMDAQFSYTFWATQTHMYQETCIVNEANGRWKLERCWEPNQKWKSTGKSQKAFQSIQALLSVDWKLPN